MLLGKIRLVRLDQLPRKQKRCSKKNRVLTLFFHEISQIEI